MQILRQLYKGKLIPLETYRSVSTEYENKREEMIVEERTFIDKLNDDDLKRTFIRIVDERTGLIPEETGGKRRNKKSHYWGKADAY